MADPIMNDWHSSAFRSRLVAQIEDTMRQAQTPMGRSAEEMENHVYQKAQSREEYMSLIARLIIHVKEYTTRNRGQQGMAAGMGPHNPMAGGGPAGMGDGQGGIDPMNALQNLARQGGQPAAQQGMMPGPQQMMHPAAQHRQQLAQQAAMMQQRGQMQQRPQLQMTQQQQQQVMMNQQRNLQKPPLERQDAFIVTSPQAIQQMQGQGLASSANMPFQQQTSGVNTMSRPGHMGPMGVQGQMQQSYLQPGSQQGAMSVGSDMSPAMQSSPAPGLPSPSPQSSVTPSPANRGMHGAPSPSTFLNTPGNPPPSVPSPSNAQHTSAEEQEYLEKLRMLSKYIDPLRRSINNLEKNKDEESKRNYMKMKNLLEILIDQNRRVSMQTLRQCELALNNWQLNTYKHSSSAAAVQRESGGGSGLLGQALYDAVAAHISSPTLNHSLQRTFGPAMSAFLGERIRSPSPPRKRQRTEEKRGGERRERGKEDELPLVLQREIANLGIRYNVSLDPLHQPANNTIHLVCKLEDLNLPSVPPVLVTIPPNYPKNSPVCEPKACPGYDASQFLRCIGKIMSEMMCRMSEYSLTALLQAWEMSVRKACARAMTSDPNMLTMF